MSIQPTGSSRSEDAVAVKIETGMVLLQDDLMVLRELVPQEIWRHREIFFHEGMRLEIGPCHRRYSPPSFFREASERFAGEAGIDKKGNLENYTAGTPFPSDQIDLEAPDAATRWAFNVEHRYRGAGHRGRFRITDFPDRIGGIQVYLGDFFLFQIMHRADLEATGYAIPKRRMAFAAGGEFTKPFDARFLAWRQFRPLKAARRYSLPDDIFAYIPSMRKVRRAATNWVDGLYVPRYTLSGDGAGGGVAYGQGGSISPTAGRSIAVSEDMRRGLIGLEFRANAYNWRYLGETNILAPLNISGGGFPVMDDRNFGPSGLSLADDRWDLRRVVIIEGAARMNNMDVKALTIYLDYQTHEPLFWVTRTGRRRLLDIGILGSRFSDDLLPIPEWPGGTTASVFQPVVAVFFDAAQGAGGWRRESYDLDSLPYTDQERRIMTTSDSLAHGH